MHRILRDKPDRPALEGETQGGDASSPEEALLVTLQRLALTGEYHEDDSGQHAQRVGAIATRLAREIGLDEPLAALIGRAALLHDVGKAGLPDALLLKPARLTDDERAIMHRHTTIGAHILAGTRVPVLQTAAEIAFTHHEGWDGRGYPRGLSGETIPLSGRIVAVADVSDALIHARPYRQAWLPSDAEGEIARQRGQRFDPRVVDAFIRLYGGRQPTEPAPLAAATTASGAAATRLVLYIDDTLTNLEFVERILSRQSRGSAQTTLTLITAMDGQSGLALASERHPDLILLDLKLPDMSGEDVLRILRADPSTQSIPVAILSADTSRGRMQQLLTMGAQSYLTKPLDLKSFTAMLHTVFNRDNET